MSLEQGQSLGRYEILERIGAGGMGEVYRARDEQLGRDVAIKVLPASLASDAERMARFEQEARAAGQLNHPNLLVLYDVGSHEGTPYLVTELLQGQTLGEMLCDGPLPVRKAVDYAAQAARGIAAAHDRGIVHRDLKPDNLFVTREGRLKILDFGLAKLRGEVSEDAETVVRGPSTEAGVVMGTVGYMSPEQVRGEPADLRSDLFALGAVLYEMLCGESPFRRDSAPETMTAVLKEDPADLSQMNPDIPSSMDRLVRHCMEKQPEERYQSARDLAFELEGHSWHSGSAAITSHEEPGRAPLSRGQLVGALLVVATVALAFAAGRTLAPAPVPERELTFQQQTFRRGNVLHARFGPDGKTIFYSASWGNDPVQVYMTRTDGRESRPLELLHADVLSTSAAGEMAILLKERFLATTLGLGTLARVPLTGGAPREVQVDVGGADWGPNGELAVIRVVDGAHILEYPQGTVLLTERNASIYAPRVSPDGELVAFVEHRAGGRVVVVDLSGERRVLSTWWNVDPDSLAWSPDGSEVVFSGAAPGGATQLRAVSLSGRERLLLPSADNYLPHDIAPDGRLLIERESYAVTLRYQSPADDTIRDLTWLDRSHVRALSADGSLILFAELGPGGGSGHAAYLRKSDGSPPIRLGDGDAVDLSPDGAWALIDPDSTDRSILLVPTGVGTTREIALEGPMVVNAGFTNDGRHIVYVALDTSGTPKTWEHDLETRRNRELLPGVETLGGRFSPDGRMVALRVAGGEPVIHPMEGGEPRPVQGAEVGDEPLQWSANGRFLFVTRAGETPQRIWRIELGTGRREIWKELLADDPAGALRIESVALSADGETFAFSYSFMASSALYVIDGLFDPAPAR